jgi:hypothetical protein
MPTISKQRAAGFAAAKAKAARTPKIQKEAKRPPIKSVPSRQKSLSILGSGGLRKAGEAISGRANQVDRAVRKATR